MSFNLWEIITQGGRPVHLYEFTWGTTMWRYTSADRRIEWPEGLDPPRYWEPIAISDEGVVQGVTDQEFTVNLPANIPLVTLFRSTPPAGSIWLRCRKFHKSDPDKAGIVYWIGTVGNIKRSGTADAKAIGLPLSATTRRTGLRLCWERNCPHMLYDQDCKADRDDFKVETEITALTSTTMTVDSLGAFDGPKFAGGFFEWEPAGYEPGTVDRRGIESHIAGKQFSIFGATDRLEVGQAITMYLGCDLTAETCDTVFDNLPNHGGFKFMPGKSPFDGTPVL